MNEVVQGNPERVVGLYGEQSGTGRLTKLDDATPASCWRPILSGTTAQQALQAVDAIAESITSLPGERGRLLVALRGGTLLLTNDAGQSWSHLGGQLEDVADLAAARI